MPLITALFAQYVALAMRPQSSAQNPEKLFRERGLMATLLLLGAAFAFTTFVNIPVLAKLSEQRYISLREGKSDTYDAPIHEITTDD
jgi:hypothetical protein